MGGVLNNFVRKYRIYLVIFLTVLGIAALIVASQIGPLTEEVTIFPKDHPLMTTQAILQNEFPSSSTQKGAFMVSIVWGVKDLDRSNVGLWDPEDLGELVWDDEFDVAPAENQQRMLELCAELKDDHALVRDNDVICWIDDMDVYVREDSKNTK